MTFDVTNINRGVPENIDRSFCDLLAHCEIGTLACRIRQAVADFFTYAIGKIYDALLWICSCGFLNDGGSALSSVEAAKALARLKQIEAGTIQFGCEASILQFDLDAALQKYSGDHFPQELLTWYDYAMPNQDRREEFENVLDGFGEGAGPLFNAVRSLVSKIHAILLEKRNRIEAIDDQAERIEGIKALKNEVQDFIDHLLNANANCIDQTASQLEDVAINLLATENLLGKDTAASLLQYRAAAMLSKYRANLVKEIIVKLVCPNENRKYVPPEAGERQYRKDGKLLQDEIADIERAVKQRIGRGVLGIKAEIIDAGAQFEKLIEEAGINVEELSAAVEKRFLEEYDPVAYLINETRVYYGSTAAAKLFRNNLIQWASSYYGVEDYENEFALAISEDKDLDPFLGGGNFTKKGVQLLLEAAGILTAG